MSASRAEPGAPGWFPDWRDGPVAIIASGPSTKQVDYRALDGRVRTLAIKENIEICPWSEAVYGCDAPFWRNAFGLPNFRGLKIAHKSDFGAVRTVRIDAREDRILTAEPGRIGSGGNSGFQALNLAIQFGARRILLVGFDMSDAHGVHWFGRSQGDGRSQPCVLNFPRWRRAFDIAAGQMRGLGVDVRNASPLTSLKCFPIMTIADALTQWDA